jgi:hypothetical protein
MRWLEKTAAANFNADFLFLFVAFGMKVEKVKH